MIERKTIFLSYSNLDGAWGEAMMTIIPNPLPRAAFAAASLAAPMSRGTVYRVQNAARGDRPASPAAKSRGTVYRVQNTPVIASR